MKRLLLIIISLLIQLPLSAQQRMILKPDKSLSPILKSKINKEIRFTNKNKFSGRKSISDLSTNNVNAAFFTTDTLNFPGPWASDFYTIYNQDWLVQWFVCPADLTLKKVGFSCSKNNTNASVEVKVVKANWSYDDLFNGPSQWYGYYKATGNGYNDITAFFDNPDRTGGWISKDSVPTEPFGEDIWSNEGRGDTLVPTVQTDGSHYDWVDLGQQDVELSRGDIFVVAVHHLGTNLTGTDNGISFYYGDFNIGGWKFYANGKNVSPPDTNADYGWWTSQYSFDFAAEIEFPGEHGLFINYVTLVESGIDNEPKIIEASITGPAVSVTLTFSIDGGSTWSSIPMNQVNDGIFRAIIPAQSPNTYVDYYVETCDSTNCCVESIPYEYYIFGPTSTNLLVFNGYGAAFGYPPSYYFGYGDFSGYKVIQWDHDTWAYGALTADLVNNYTNILEICTGGPLDINNDVIKAWLDTDASHNYMLMGDEWLGYQTGWRDTTYKIGDFQYDILGIIADHNDINYETAGDQTLSSVVYPQEGSLLGGDLFTLYNDVITTNSWTAPMQVDPYYEVGVPNWLDGVDFLGDVEVDITGVAVDGTTEYSIGGHRTLTAGNKVAFFTFDGLSLDSDTENEVEYYWYGFTTAAPQVKAVECFGIPADVKSEENKVIPNTFEIYQNYPNPFNPTTTIRYRIPETGLITLKVYDILGRDVATLVNEEKITGTYEIEFDSHSGEVRNLTSGVYFYQLKFGNFIKTKKMILLR